MLPNESLLGSLLGSSEIAGDGSTNGVLKAKHKTFLPHSMDTASGIANALIIISVALVVLSIVKLLEMYLKRRRTWLQTMHSDSNSMEKQDTLPQYQAQITSVPPSYKEQP